MNFNARELAKFISDFEPSTEQTEIIEYSSESPLLIIAGAGSGKTATMAQKILYLIVNEIVKPEEILCLTFTKKAVSELSSRIRAKMFSYQSKLNENQNLRTAEFEDFPQVSTYDSFASSVVDEFGTFFELDPPKRIIGTTEKFLLMKQAILEVWQQKFETEDLTNSTVELDSEILEDEEELNISSLANSLVILADALVSNSIQTDDYSKWIQKQLINETLTGALNERRSSKSKQIIAEIIGYAPEKLEGKEKFARCLEKLKLHLEYLPIIERYFSLKESKGLSDFADQQFKALKIVNGSEEVCQKIKERFKFVILDEYQDTSFAQVDLLRAIFNNGFPITAVGDPNQAIYAWRGASTDSIFDFPNNFRSSSGEFAEIKSLSTTYRNSKKILDVANSITAKFREEVGVQNNKPNLNKVLQPKPNAEDGIVKVELCLSDVEKNLMPFNFVPELNQTEREVSELKSEANAAISFIQEYWNPEDPESPAKTAAIIMPVNKDIQLIAQALEKAGIEYQINSEGALLSLPEIQDILCLLRLSVKADDESSITRLLTGSFLEFSPYLINKLSRILKNVNANRRTEFEKNFENESSELEYIPISLFEILEDFEYKKVLEKELKEEALNKLKLLGMYINNLKQMKGVLVSQIVLRAISLLNLRDELKVFKESDSSSRTIEAFLNFVYDFENAELSKTDELEDFLEWVEYVIMQDEKVEIGAKNINPNAVQIISAHSSKGLEWDLVCSLSNSRSQFIQDRTHLKPESIESILDETTSSSGWITGKTAVPDQLKLERKSLKPFFEPETYSTIHELDLNYETFSKAAGKRDFAEKRRLAYVVYTRAKTHLLITAPLFIRDTSGAKIPSQFFAEAYTASGGELKVLQNQLNSVLDLDFRADRSSLVKSWPGGQFETSLSEFEKQRLELKNKVKELVKAKQSTKLDESEINQLLESDLELKTLVDEFESEKNSEIPELDLPNNIGVSSVVKAFENYEQLLKNMNRPLPDLVTNFNSLGNEVHSEIAKILSQETIVFKNTKNDLVNKHIETILESDLVKLKVKSIEEEIVFQFANKIVTARLDAVFETENGLKIVDWKTGAIPKDDDLENKAIQLAIYKQAFLERYPEFKEKDVKASFFYTKTGREIEFSSKKLDELASLAKTALTK